MKAREFFVVSHSFEGWGEGPRSYGLGGLVVNGLDGSRRRFRNGRLIQTERLQGLSPSGQVLNRKGDVIAFVNVGEKQSHLVFPSGRVPGGKRHGDGAVWVDLPLVGANDATAILDDEGELTHIVVGCIGVSVKDYAANPGVVPAKPLMIYSLKNGSIKLAGKPRKCYNGLAMRGHELFAAVSHENALVAMDLESDGDRIVAEVNVPDGIATDGKLIYVAQPYASQVVAIDPISGSEVFTVKSPNGEAAIAPAIGTYQERTAVYCVLTELNAPDSGRGFFDAKWRVGVHVL